MIPFFKKTVFDKENQLLTLLSRKDESNTDFRKLCSEIVVKDFNYPNFFLTKSCTQSLELSILIAGLPERSEVIIPSYAFVSLANAIVLRGLTPVFVDCEKGTMNIDAVALENAITSNTSAVITINYGGVSCDYDTIKRSCKKHNLVLIEDNAHGMGATYKDIPLGNFGDIMTVSFDFLKNISCYEGGGITINDCSMLERFRLAYEFGTNKMDFMEGLAPFYEWKTMGSNYAMAQPLSAILYEQLTNHSLINSEFKRKWNTYYGLLLQLKTEGIIDLAEIPDYANHNGHMFWMKVKNTAQRNELIQFLKSNGIITQFHYTPLHTSAFGIEKGVFSGEDLNTTIESSKLIRLPLFFDLKDQELMFVVSKIYDFFDVEQKVTQLQLDIEPKYIGTCS